MLIAEAYLVVSDENCPSEAIRTEQHEGLLALSGLEVRLGQQHERLQGLDSGLINIELQAGAPCILLTEPDGGIVTSNIGGISWHVRLIAAIAVM